MTAPARTDAAADDPLGPSLWRPTIGWAISLYIVLVFFLPSRLVMSGPLGAAGRPALLVGLGLLAIWCLLFLYPGERRPFQPVRWMLGAYLVAWFASLVMAYSRGLSAVESAGIERFLLITLSLVGVGLVVADLVPDREVLDTLLARLTYGAAFMGAIGFVQFFFGIAPLQDIQLPGLSAVDGEFVGLGSRGDQDLVRAIGTAAHSIEFGVLSAMVFPIAVHRALGAAEGERWKRWLIAALVVCGVPFSLARSGIIAVVLVLFVLMRHWNDRTKRRAYLVVLGSLVLLRGTVPGLVGTFVSFFANASNDNSVEGRTQDFPEVIELVTARPWLGLGGGTFRPEEYFFLDNYILNALISTGVIGLATVLVLFIGTYGLCIRMARRADRDEDRSLAAAIAAGVLGGFGASFTFDSLNFASFGSTLFLLVGAAGALWRLQGRRPPTRRELRYRRVLKTRRDAWPIIHRYLLPRSG